MGDVDISIVTRRLEEVRSEMASLMRQYEIEAAKEELLSSLISPMPHHLSAPRSSIKQAVLDLLKDSGFSGLNARVAVEKAKESGLHLDRGTVSSMLSRLKNEGLVKYDGQVYRLLPPKPQETP